MKRFVYNTVVAAGVVGGEMYSSGHATIVTLIALVGWVGLSAIDWWDARNLDRARAMRALERGP